MLVFVLCTAKASLMVDKVGGKGNREAGWEGRAMGKMGEAVKWEVDSRILEGV